jgi:hypothetical protein
MAIKVNGTTVIDDSRNVQNVGGFKTVNGTSVVGSGNISAGASTSLGAVGTYAYGRPANNTSYGVGATASNITTLSAYGTNVPYWWPASGFQSVGTSQQLSGTWRTMTGAHSIGTGTYEYSSMGLWVRIS